MVFLITATSRVHYYEEGGNRTHHNYIEFKAGQFCFTKDCIFDVNFIDHLEEINFLNHKEDIEEKTVLPESILKKIYNLILNSKTISHISFKKVSLKFFPSLVFEIDDSLDKYMHIDALLKRIDKHE